MSFIIHSDSISLNTKGFGDTQDISEAVAKILKRSDVQNGLVSVMCQGSTGTITTIEFDPGWFKTFRKH